MISYLVTFAALVATFYLFITYMFSALYSSKSTDESKTVTFVLPTVAEKRNRDTLFDVIEHHIDTFSNCNLYVVVDEGAELVDELTTANGFETVIVPDTFDPNSVAKGRAQEYFVRQYADDDEWYAFIDDDSKVMDKTFMKEIPYYNEEGYVAANGVLWPRLGQSKISFIIDHMRTFLDVWVMRGVTGWMGKPYFGLHGELLLVKGEVLNDIGFNENSIVEDFVFADKLIQNDYKTWQTQTNISILSPHSIRGLFKQRRRWLKGRLSYYRDASLGVLLASVCIDIIWMLGILSTWILGVVALVTSSVTIPLVMAALASISAAIFTSVYIVGIYRLAHESGWHNLLFIFVLPIFATIEHIAAWYALLTKSETFQVIDK